MYPIKLQTKFIIYNYINVKKKDIDIIKLPGI